MPSLFALTVGKMLISTPRSFIDVSSTKGDDNDMPQVCLGDDILLKPDTRYCLSPDPDVEAKTYRRAASDEGSDTEDSSTSDENGDNRSKENEADAESDVEYVITSLNPFRVANGINQYCAALVLTKIKQELVSDSEITTQSEVNETEADSSNNQVNLPADRRPRGPDRPRVHQCDHEGCSYATDYMCNLKNHKQAHLPVHQRSRVYQCDYEGCNYIANLAGNLKRHKKTHLPADLRSRGYQCDHEGCNYSTDRMNDVKKHKQTHLPADQRARKYQCDHEGCNYSTDSARHLKAHKQTHLPADQRSRGYRCDHKGCNYSTDHRGNLKAHKQTHLPADQRPKRPKRKAYDQPLSNEKRKKGDQE